MTDFFILMKPELLVAAIIFILLFIRIGKGMDNSSLLVVVQVLLLLNFIAGFVAVEEGSLFGGLYKTSLLTGYQKNILNLGVFLISLLFADWFKQCTNLAEYFILLLSALMGMQFLLSSGNLLLFYLSLELSTIPVAAMVNFTPLQKKSSEAAMKMILTSAFSSGILLFGISLVYGVTGSLSFEQIALLIQPSALHIMAFVFLFAAFAFKLSIVPFHLWTADVYEGAPVSTTAFLSVISKGAFSFVFITALYKVFAPLLPVWHTLIMVLALLTLVTGNLFALRQQNIKRFLAFSSIAQVGFILVGISGLTPMSVASVVYFVLIYIFSNLAAFGVVSVIAALTGKENIDDYKGLNATNPFLSWIMALALFSLAGVPPTAGFFGKLFLITAGAKESSYAFIIIVAINLVISLYYYLKIVRAMFMDKNETPVPPLKITGTVKLGLLLCAAGIVVTGFISWIYDYILSLT